MINHAILDNCLVRTNKLGSFEVKDFREFEYWEIRFVLPNLINSGAFALKEYFETKYNIGKVKNNELLSFFYYILDGLKEIADFENEHLTFNTKSNVVHGMRAREFAGLMEVHMLSGGCPIKKEKIKSMKYKDVFETLFAMSIDSEKKIIKTQ